MTDPAADQLLAAALGAMARRAAPDLLAQALDEGRAEVRSILRRQVVEALLDESAHQARWLTIGERDARTEHTRAPDGAVSRRPASATKTAAVECGVYVYGFTSGVPERFTGLSGIDGSATYPVIEGGLAAVVSDVAGQRHQWGIGANGEPDLALLAPRLEEHERVLEAILEHGAVLPMRFGTLYASRSGVSDVLRAHAMAIGAVLKRLDGKVEWGLTVTWGRQQADAALLGTDGDGTTSVLQTTSAPGRAYLEKREAERAHVERLAERRSAVLAQLHRSIDRVAAASVVQPSRRADNDNGLDTLLRASYLVDKADRERFEAVIVAALEAGADLGLSGELTGPWPPYNFSELEFEEVSA